MSKEKKLISLKEAAEISGYSSDYIGQLIRAGKIYGKQIYCHIAWVTTAEEVLTYKQKNEKQRGDKASINDYLSAKRKKILMEINIIKLFFQTFKSSLPVLILLIVGFLLFNFFLFYYFSNQTDFKDNMKPSGGAVEQPLSY